MVPGPAVMKKQANPFWEKAQEFGHWTGHPAQKGPYLLWHMAPLHLAVVAESFSISIWKGLLPLTNWPRPWTTSHAAAQAGPQVQTKDKAREESEVVGSGWEKKLPAKEMSPPRGHPYFEQGLTPSTTLVENKKAQLVVISHNVDPSSWLFHACGVP